MTSRERRPALLLAVAGALLALLGFAIPDERYAALAWLLAAPMLAGGLLTLTWGNARSEIMRHLPSQDRR